jgi:myotubularin-related protein 1/2
MVKEMKRQKVPEDSWIASKINEKYDLCPSYPSILYVPTKANEETIRGSAKYRSSKRFPALTYYCKESGGCLTRCAQPMAGIMGKSSKEDQEYFDLIRQTCGEMASLVIIDARSKVAAGGNRFRGKGTEKLSTYKNSRMIFMEIENIHAMRSSIDSLFNICTMHKLAESEWLNSLSSTQWLTHVQGCISAAITTAKYVAQLGESVLVHCSDGWDRTSQICALAELIIDPFYRTTKGFQILIEKEFCAFGHKFGHRMGNAEHPDERSPIFLQFLDCTWQILQQFPNSFEFSSKYLLYIFDYAYSGWFGNFLDNNEHDRKRRQERFPALSIWAALDNEVMTDSCFRNPSFEVAAEFSKAVLNPSSSIKVLRLWSEAFLRYDRIFFATDGVEELNQDGASSKEDSEKIEYKRNEDQKTSPESPKEQKRMNSDSDSDEEVELAVWMPKKDALECKACQKAFSLWRKKRHCYSW